MSIIDLKGNKSAGSHAWLSRLAGPVVVVCALIGGTPESRAGFESCTTSAVYNGDYCGGDRGNYVLKSNGTALWVTETQDNLSILKLRRPNPNGAGFIDSILMRAGDPVPASAGPGASGIATIDGLGSNPHVNSSGQAVWQAEYLDDLDATYTALFVSDENGVPELVARDGFARENSDVICTGSIQPWPQIDDSGVYVFAAHVRSPASEVLETKSCSRQDGDKIQDSNYVNNLAVSAVVNRVYRGVVGGGQALPVLTSTAFDGLVGEPVATEFSADATNPFLVDPLHPLIRNGMLTYAVRGVTAISHSAGMVAKDGSMAVTARIQALVSTAEVQNNDGFYRPTATVSQAGFGYRAGKFQPAVVFVDSAGQPELVAAGNRTEGRYLSAATVASDASGVLYRTADSQYLDGHMGSAAQDSTTPPVFVLKRGLYTAASAPTGVSVARPWETQILREGGGAFQYWNVTTNAVDNSPDVKQGTVIVGTASPEIPSEYTLSLHSTIRDRSLPDAAGGLTYYVPSQVVGWLDAGNEVRLRPKINSYALPNFYTTETDPQSYSFALSSEDLEQIDRTQPRFYDGGIRWWNAATKQTVKVMSFNDVTPAGYSRFGGVSPHFSEGAGIVGFKTELVPPKISVPGGDASATGLLLKIADPCGSTATAAPEDSSMKNCEAIYSYQAGQLVEVARNMGAEEVFGLDDDPALVGVSKAGDFEFYGFGSAVAVSDTGTMFFTAEVDFSANGTNKTFPDDSDCDVDDLNDSGWRTGVFQYNNSVVSKVLAVGDTVPLNGGDAVVLGIATPQPELRQGVAGDSILLDVMLDTDKDCLPDTVGLARLGDENSDYITADVGHSVGAFGATGQQLTLSIADTESGWTMRSLSVGSAASAENLTADEASGGLLTFIAENPSIILADGPAGSTLQLKLAVNNVSADQILGLIKDLPSKPDLLDSVVSAVDDASSSVISFSIVDNGAYDFDKANGKILDPFGLFLIGGLPPLPPLVPIPVLPLPFLLILSGLVSLVGGAFTRRRGAVAT